MSLDSQTNHLRLFCFLLFRPHMQNLHNVNERLNELDKGVNCRWWVWKLNKQTWQRFFRELEFSALALDNKCCITSSNHPIMIPWSFLLSIRMTLILLHLFLCLLHNSFNHRVLGYTLKSIPFLTGLLISL